MELSQAISQAIKEFGKDILAEKRVINVLKDYNAFSAKAQCDIMIAIVEDGKLYDLLKQTGFATTGILQFSFYSTEKKKKKLKLKKQLITLLFPLFP